MLDDPTFERYLSKVFLKAVGSLGQGEQGFLIWECVYSSVIVRNFLIDENND